MIKVKNVFDFYKVRSNFLGFQKCNPNFDVNYDGLFSTFDLDNPLSKKEYMRWISRCEKFIPRLFVFVDYYDKHKY